MNRRIFVFLLVIGAGAGVAAREVLAQRAAARVMAPAFDVDPLWPKPLPNHWVVGSVIGVSVDRRDHVWIIHRPGSLDRKERYRDQTPQAGECCSAAPPVLEFDEAGNLVGHWGGPGQGYEWPESNHGIFVDYKDNVWIGGNGAPDAQVLKFTRDGKFLMQIGRSGVHKAAGAATEQAAFGGNSTDTKNFGRAAKIFVDAKSNEAYIADGYLNRRVAVIDADTGQMKRFWGAYGHKPTDVDSGPYNPDAPIDQQFRTPVHCADLSVDNLLYVCDRRNDRLQVFKPDGTFVKEQIIGKRSLGDGAVFDVAFSRDAQQAYLYIADGTNMKVRILRRDTLEELTSFGDGGRQPGQFYAVHSIATDSKGNIYTTETYEGKRVQKFNYRGLRPVGARDQGVVWPAARP